MPEGSSFDFTIHFENSSNDVVSASVSWPNGSVSGESFNGLDLNAQGYTYDNGTISADASTSWASYGWPYIGHWDLSDVYNVQPTATLAFDPGDAGGDSTLSLLDPFDPSGADTNEGFHYSAAGLYGNLAGTYGEASTANSFAFDDDDGDGVIWIRIFDKDGGYSDYNTSYVLPTLNIGTVTASSVALSWNAEVATGETGWYVQRAPFGGSFSTVATLDPGSSSYTDDTVHDGTRYQYRVRAFGTPGTASDTAYSAKRSLTTEWATPTRVTVTEGASPDTATIAWQDNSENETGFQILQSAGNGEFTEVASVNPDTTSFVVDDLDPSLQYVYQIVAVGTTITPRASAATPTRSAVRVPTNVGPLTITPTFDVDDNAGHQLRLVFNNNVASSLSAGDLLLDSLTTGDAVSPIFSYNAGTKTATLTFSGGFLAEGAYQLRILKGAVTGMTQDLNYTFTSLVADGNQNGIVDMPDAAGLIANAGQLNKKFTEGNYDRAGIVGSVDFGLWFYNLNKDVRPRTFNVWATSETTIQLSWDDNLKNETGWRVERSTDGTTFTTLATLGANPAQPFVDSGLSVATKYWYRVVPFDGGGDGIYTLKKGVSTLLPTPDVIDLTPDPADPSKIGLDVDPNLGGVSELDVTVVVMNSVDGGPFVEIGSFPIGDLPELDLVEGTHNVMRIYLNRGDTRSNATFDIVHDVPPNAPTGPSASSATSSSVVVSWNDESAHETGYEIRALDLDGIEVKRLTIGANLEQATVAGLTEGLKYTFITRATTAGAKSDPVETAGATKLAAPTGLHAFAPTPYDVNLKWTDVSTHETWYELSSGGGGQTLAANSTGTSIGALMDGTQYTFTLTAHNDFSVSDPVTITWRTAATVEEASDSSHGYRTIRTLVPGDIGESLDQWTLNGPFSDQSFTLQSNLLLEDGGVPVPAFMPGTEHGAAKISGSVKVTVNGVEYQSGSFEDDPLFGIAEIHDRYAVIVWRMLSWNLGVNRFNQTTPDHYEDYHYLDPHDADPTYPGDPNNPANDIPVVSIAATDDEGSEVGNDTITFTVTRTGSTSDSLDVYLQPPAGTATKDTDYWGWPVGAASMIQIPAGHLSTSFTLTPRNDNLIEPEESIVVQLESGSQYVLADGGTSQTTASARINGSLMHLDFNYDGSINAADDQVAVPSTGYIVAVNDDDTDQDGVPDYADGFDLFADDARDNEHGDQLQLARLTLPASINVNVAKVKFVYSYSAPSSISRTGDWNVGQPRKYPVSGSGCLRLWKSSPNATRWVRSKLSLQDGGNLIVNGESFDANKLFAGSEAYIELEGIKASANGAISVQMLVDRNGDGNFALDQQVALTARKRERPVVTATVGAGGTSVTLNWTHSFSEKGYVVR